MNKSSERERMIFLYVRIYISSTKINNNIRNILLFIISNKSIIKKKKNINKINNFYKIFIFIFINFIFSS